MAASSCSDDIDEGGLFFDDSLFKGRADAPTLRPSSSQKRFNTRKRGGGGGAEERCKNCGATCLQLVFNCACTVECALGYFLGRKEANNFVVISANFRLVPAYRNLHVLPQPAHCITTSGHDEKKFLGRSLENLYPNEGDPRRAAYLQQLTDNNVSASAERDVLQRIA